jgi:uncharacterized protein with von Willebrand factor type A (vWA) domain
VTAYSPDPRHLEGSAERGSTDRSAGRAARYSRWDGSQGLPDLDADEILDALADDVMAEGDLGEALRRLMERGWRPDDPTRSGLAGLDELRERLRRERASTLERHGLDDVLGDIRRELDEIVRQERQGVARRLDEASRPASADEGPDDVPADADRADRADRADLRRMLRDVAARRIDQLDALPDDVGERIRQLREYDFLEPDARQRFDDLIRRLERQVLDRYSAGLSEAIREMRPEDLAMQREMVRDLNELLRERMAGGDPDASTFLDRHGRFFPGARSLDDVIDQLAERMGAMQSLLLSMTPEQRAELASLTDALLRDDRLRWDLAQLAANVDALVPGGLGERMPFHGDRPLGLESAFAQIARLQMIDALDGALADVEVPADLRDIDRDALGDVLGPDALRDLEALDALSRRLEQAGYLTRTGERLELTPRGSRRIGQKVLDDLFARLKRDAFGGHRIERAGRGGEREDTTKSYEFGDPFHLDLTGTIANALTREENAPRGRGTGTGARAVALGPADFQVHRTGELTRSATVLLVDMSRSMLLRGCFVAAKKVAVALETLIRTQFPRDHLSVVGFAYHAREIRPGALAELNWHGYEYGTNLQHGLLLARRILARQAAANREIIVITDGEPTAHFEDGHVEFSYPPTRRTISETLREVDRCTREGITINTFMLERSRALAEFVALMTRRNRGRAFYATPEQLGEYVLVDFVAGRTKRIS